MNLVLKSKSDHVEYYNEPLEKEDKVVIIDADSLAYMASYPGKDDYGNKLSEYGELDHELVEGKLRELLLTILNNIEKRFNIIDYHLCIRGKDNFRKKLYTSYKSNRPSKPEILGHIYSYMESDLEAIPANGYEADDLVYTLSKNIDNKGVIVAIDKDMLQIPSMFYNFQKDEWLEVSETQAKFNLAIQILIGDPGDNINFTPRFGINKALRVIHEGMTDFQYIKAILTVYKKIWGNVAKENLRLCYRLLKLHEIKND